MEALINLGNTKPAKGDVMLFDGKSWGPVPRDAAFDDVMTRMTACEDAAKKAAGEVAAMRKQLAEMARIMKEHLI